MYKIFFEKLKKQSKKLYSKNKLKKCKNSIKKYLENHEIYQWKI